MFLELPIFPGAVGYGPNVDQSLDKFLQQRCRWATAPEQSQQGPGEFVLYWMHNALRVHENPALDVAVSLARQNGLPLLVYLGLSEDYPYASDRLHAFILSGQRDVCRQLDDAGISYVCHVQRPGHRGPHLKKLLQRTAVLVTEEMPVQPIVGWLERLLTRISIPTAIVDCHCILPAGLLPNFNASSKTEMAGNELAGSELAEHEAGEHQGSIFYHPADYRRHTDTLYAELVSQPYPRQPVDCLMWDETSPVKQVCLADVDLADLIGRCQIDHSIPPVAGFCGGSRAGYRRWNQFVQHDLQHYSATREKINDPVGNSQISAYIHFGMVSPFRIAREAAAAGATDFLDQFLIWREMAFHFCFSRQNDLDSIDALPEWVTRTLHAHADDQRDKTLSWETLARGRTGVAFWDACQRVLRRTGSLHNTARMDWGKSLLRLTSTPGCALHYTIDLNHRFAIDGRDTSSYGGILWCFGAFDNPSSDETPIFGKIPRHSMSDQPSDSELEKFIEQSTKPITGSRPKIAIVGAGIGGLVAARTLSDYGLDITVYEKSRGVGGRLATRRADLGSTSAAGSEPLANVQLPFDHGAQYFTARDARFQRYVRSWIDDGITAAWMGRIVELGHGGKVFEEKLGTPRYVGIPSNNAIAKHVAADQNVLRSRRITSIEKDPTDCTWSLIDSDGKVDGGYNVVLFNAPPPQTSMLVAQHADWSDQLDRVQMKPCWSMMLHTTMPTLDYDAAFINQGPLSWIARNDNKPQRPAIAGSAWVIHANAEWSAEHLDDDPATVRTELLSAFADAIGQPIGPVEHCRVHLWRYSIPKNALSCEYLWDAAAGLGACGDWLCGGRVEGAFLSGQAVAGAVMRHATIDRPAG